MSIPGAASPLLLAATAAVDAGPFKISRSLRLNSGDSAYLSKTPSSAGNRRTFTWSGWVKRSGLGAQSDFFSAGNSSDYLRVGGFNSSDKLELRSDSAVVHVVTEQVFRDASAWYHIVIAVDTTQSTSSNRVKFYVNGSQITDFSTSSYPSQNRQEAVNDTGEHRVGAFIDKTSATVYYPFNGYLADVHFIDGQQLAPTDFGETDSDNNWNPKAYSGTYGTNGFHLDFSDNTSTTTIAEDSSGNNNDWTANNLSVASGAGNDSLIDTPTNYEASSGNNGGNYPTFNPISQQYSTAVHVLTNGNLQHGDGSSEKGNYSLDISTMAAPPSGKWYWEMTTDGNGTNERRMIGIMAADANFAQYIPHDNSTDGLVAIWLLTGQKIVNGSKSSYTSSFRQGNVVGVALDQDGQAVNFYVNNTAQGSISLPSNMQGKSIVAAVSSIYEGENIIANFGQRPFTYTPPTGYKSLCTQNLPDPTIADGSTAMDIALYNGNGGTQSVSGLNLAPDWVWIKNRNGTHNHMLFDIVRGAGEDLQSNSTATEGAAGSNDLTSFDSSGFSLGSNNAVNQSAKTYVAWAWDAGTSTASNTDGSITSNVRANASAGFSIVSYTGTGSNATFGHGLNAAPSLVIVKSRSDAHNWAVQHSDLGPTYYLYLQSSNAASTTNGGPFWNNTAPTSSTVSVGTDNDTNASSKTYIAYCFAPVAGYSAFGSYSSGSDPFVFTGFAPRFVLLKKSSAAGHWYMFDSERGPINPNETWLEANGSGAEQTHVNGAMRFLSNGFQPVGSDIDAASSTYIWAAFASHPFKTARAR